MSDGKTLSKPERAQLIHEQSVGPDDFLTTKAATRNDDSDTLPQPEPIRGKRLFDLCAALRFQKLKWLGHGLRLNDDELLKKFIVGVCWPKYQKGLADYGIFQDAFTGLADLLAENTTIEQLIALAGNHSTDDGRRNVAAWRRRTIQLVPEAERSKSNRMPAEALTAEQRAARCNLTADERNELHKAATIEKVSAMPTGSLLLYTDGGGADGGGVGLSGWGVCVTTKGEDWSYMGELDQMDALWGPVITNSTSQFWLGSQKGTNNTAELNGAAQALIWLRNEGGHAPAAILYDSEYAGQSTTGAWNGKANLEAIRINRELYEAEHARRRGGVQLIHVKGHHEQPGNESADQLAHAGKDRKPYSRIALTCTTDPTPSVPQERVHAYQVLSARKTKAAQAKERKSRGLASQTLAGRRRQTVASGPSPRTTSPNAVQRTAVHGSGPSTPSAGRPATTGENMQLITISA